MGCFGCLGGNQREGEGWTRQQWGVLATLVVSHLCNGMTVALQAPFYPAEAERKGATATEYGLVFGIFQLAAFVVSPIIGKYLPKIGIRRAFSGGLGLTSVMVILFGLLNHVNGVDLFISLSFIIRIVTAFGYSAFLSSSFTLVAQLFPSTVATVFAIVEMSFGVGMIIGPTVGGALFEAGGYTLPFGVLGGVLLGQSIISTQTLPPLEQQNNDREREQGFGMTKALTIPSVLIAAFAVFSGSISVGALQATLERHLAQFDYDPMQVGFFFMMYGGAYALPNPFWGWVADRYTPKMVILIGSFFLIIGHVLVGPVPGLGLHFSYALCVVSVILAGIGLGALLVATFSEAQKSAVARGFPDDVSTHALVSSIWTSAFALGSFVGPTACGALYEVIGFAWAMIFTVGWNLTVFVLMMISIMVERMRKKGERSVLYQRLEGGDYGSMREERKEEGYMQQVEDGLQGQDSYQTL